MGSEHLVARTYNTTKRKISSAQSVRAPPVGFSRGEQRPLGISDILIAGLDPVILKSAISVDVHPSGRICLAARAWARR